MALASNQICWLGHVTGDWLVTEWEVRAYLLVWPAARSHTHPGTLIDILLWVINWNEVTGPGTTHQHPPPPHLTNTSSTQCRYRGTVQCRAVLGRGEIQLTDSHRFLPYFTLVYLLRKNLQLSPYGNEVRGILQTLNIYNRTKSD